VLLEEGLEVAALEGVDGALAGVGERQVEQARFGGVLRLRRPADDQPAARGREDVVRIGQIKPAKGATRDRKRRGLGPASGLGGTAGKGHKGQLARTGGKVARWFEGGQMPIQRRLPKVGFKNPTRVEYQVLNLDRLASYGAGDTVDRASLKAKRLIDRADLPVKLLGMGDVAGGLKISVDAVSASARQKIEAAGGTVTVPEPRKYRPRGVKKTPRS